MLATWLLVTTLSICWVYLAVVTVELILDCYYTIKNERRWRY